MRNAWITFAICLVIFAIIAGIICLKFWGNLNQTTQNLTSIEIIVMLISGALLGYNLIDWKEQSLSLTIMIICGLSLVGLLLAIALWLVDSLIPGLNAGKKFILIVSLSYFLSTFFGILCKSSRQAEVLEDL